MPLLAPPGTPTAVQLARALRAREVSAREVLAEHLARIEAVDPLVNAVVTLVAEQAQARAAQLDQQADRTAGVQLVAAPGADAALLRTARVAAAALSAA